MEELRQRIVDDLAGALKGDLRCDPLALAMYATDASLYEITPLGVVCPRDRDDVVTLAKYAAETETPLIARGAGTGLAGSAIGNGLIVDFSRYMNQIEQIDESTVRVQPGVVNERLNRVLREHGRYFPPDPSNTLVTTIGGMLGVDAAGSHAIRVGSARDHVIEIEVVLSGGEVLEAGVETLNTAVHSTRLPAGFADGEAGRRLSNRVAALLRENADVIEANQPASFRNCSGYQLHGVLQNDRLHLARMLVGSEGTLGLFTAATLHTAPLPSFRGVALLLFGDFESAMRAVTSLAPQQPSACDLLDRRLLSLAREDDPTIARMIDPAAEAALIVEQTGFSDSQVRSRIEMALRRLRRERIRFDVAREAYEYDDVEFLWSLPGRVVPSLSQLKGTTRALPFVEDIAVPPELLGEFMEQALRVLQKHEVTATLYAHAASGQLHLRPFLAPPSAADGPVIESLSRELYELVISLGGTISGEHGDGISRTAFIRSQYGPLYRVFQELKDIFDPQHLLNPGRIVSDDPHLTIRHFRPRPEPQVTELQLQWTSAELAAAADACNGCGVCRTQSSEHRMCPFFRNDPSEIASPRAKANVMRSIVSGLTDRALASPSEMQELGELCFNCKQCRIECPTGVDVPKLMIEAKAEHVANNGLARPDWILSRAHSFGAIGCRTSLLLNRLLSNRSARWMMEQVFGIARNRKLPRFARKPFIASVRRTLGTMPRPSEYWEGPVPVYFVDYYANYHDPELASAFVEVLRRNQIPVYVPEQQTSSGMAMVSAGDLRAARQLAERNLRELADLAREGHPIVCTEPAAALCLSEEYPALVDHPDMEVLASQVVDAGSFLGRLHSAGKLDTAFQPLELDAAWHTPCHSRALESTTPLLELLSLIPGLRVHRIEEGCSGMAGAFGLSARHFETSLEIGRRLIDYMTTADVRIGLTECSSCKMQMEQGSTTPTLHPIKILALAYGLMPQIEARLRQARPGLVVT